MATLAPDGAQTGNPPTGADAAERGDPRRKLRYYHIGAQCPTPGCWTGVGGVICRREGDRPDTLGVCWRCKIPLIVIRFKPLPWR